VTPGELDPPVFETDFGKIGIQICFDIKFDEGWDALKRKGAQIVFWPSAYAAGREISSRAWRHQMYIVTSTQSDTSKICDLTGEPLSQTGKWQPNWTVASLNLQKTFIHAWPAVEKFSAMERKYGSRIRIQTFSEEEWTMIECLDENLDIDDILKEFQLKNMYDSLNDLSLLHSQKRKQPK
jgi:hypothetical protein